MIVAMFECYFKSTIFFTCIVEKVPGTKACGIGQFFI